MKNKTRFVCKVKLLLLSLLILSMPLNGQSLAADPAPQAERSEAVPKDETIFVNLGGGGRIKEIYVINAFRQPNGKIVDFGDYAALVNLTNDSEPEIEGERITFEAGGENGIFRYQGRLIGRELPWIFELAYYLDGRRLELRDLPGASGRLRMEISVRANPAAQEYFRERFMLQISVPLKMDKAGSIYAPAAVRVVAGNLTTLAFTLLPGEAGIFTVEADVERFEMGGIEIAAMRAELALGRMGRDLQSGFDELADGTGEMIDGTEALKEGMAEFSYGAERLYGALAKINENSPALVAGIDGFGKGLTEFKGGLQKLETGSDGLYTGLSQAAGSLPALLGGFHAVEIGIAGTLEHKTELQLLAAVLDENSDPKVRALAKAMLAQLKALEQIYAGIEGSNGGLEKFETELGRIVDQHAVFGEGLKESVAGASGLEAGFTDLSSGLRGLLAGIGGISEGAGTMSESAAVLPAEVQKLIDGQKEMQKGIIEARDEMLEVTEGEEGQTVSFVSPGKANAQSVQFVLRTPPVEMPEKPVSPDNYREDGKNVWQRFQDLFQGIGSRFTLSRD